MDAGVETRIAVLASLTSVPPGVRNNDNAFVKTSFANLSRFPSANSTSNIPPPLSSQPTPTTAASTTTGGGRTTNSHNTGGNQTHTREHGNTKASQRANANDHDHVYPSPSPAHAAQGQGLGHKGGGGGSHRSPPGSPVREGTTPSSNDHESMDGGDVMADEAAGGSSIDIPSRTYMYLH